MTRKIKTTYIKKIFLIIIFVFSLQAPLIVNAVSLDECSKLSSTAYKSASSWMVNPISNTGYSENNQAKECALQSIKSSMQKEVLKKISKSTIDWVNSGFDGRPAYMTDPYSVLRSTREKVVEDVIYGDSVLEFVSSDYEIPLKFAINDYYFNQKPGELNYKPVSTIDPYQEEAFSWSGFLSKNLNPSNNLFDLYYNTINSIDSVVEEREKNMKEEIERGKGYFSLRSCEDGWEYDGSPEASRHCKIVTPGYTIAEQVGKAIGSDLDRALLADETDELMGTLVDGLLNKTLGGGGLASISEPNYSSLNNKTELFSSEKERLLVQFDSRAYDIAIKILTSEGKTVANAKKSVQENMTCWSNQDRNQKNNIKLYNDISIKTINPENPIEKKYEILTAQTILNHIDYVNNGEYFAKISIDKNKIDQSIRSLLEEKSKVEGIQAAIIKAEDYSELHNIINYSNISGVDLDSLKNDKKTLENKYNNIINGNIQGYDGSTPLRKSGVGTSTDYCQKFNITEIESDASVSNSREGTDLLNKSIKNIVDGYDPYYDILSLNNGANIDFDLTSLNIGEQQQDISYKDLISIKHSSKAGDIKYVTFKDFFQKEVKTKLNKGKDYLALLTKGYIGSFSDYSFNSYLVDKKITYPKMINGDLIDNVSGAGEYCTKDGWNRYKVYLPPSAKKIAILFKPERDILHRIHLTYEPIETISHQGVKTLTYADNPSDSKHYGLSDLFEKQKTVLINSKYKGLFLSDIKEGVSVAGLVLGKDKLQKYIDENGGWMYIDIAQDLNALGKKIYSKNNKMKIFYYVDIDKNKSEYLNWINNIDQYIVDKNISVVEEKCL